MFERRDFLLRIDFLAVVEKQNRLESLTVYTAILTIKAIAQFASHLERHQYSRFQVSLLVIVSVVLRQETKGNCS